MSSPVQILKRQRPQQQPGAILDAAYARGSLTVIGYGAAKCYQAAVNDADTELAARALVSREIGHEWERKLYFYVTCVNATSALTRRFNDIATICARLEPLAPALAKLGCTPMRNDPRKEAPPTPVQISVAKRNATQADGQSRFVANGRFGGKGGVAAHQGPSHNGKKAKCSSND